MRKLITRLTLLLAFGLLAGAILAQSPKPPLPSAPVIPDSVRAEYFKAQSQEIQAAAVAEKRHQVFLQVVETIKNVCGDRFDPQMNQQGDPACVAKPGLPQAPKEKK